MAAADDMPKVVERARWQMPSHRCNEVAHPDGNNSAPGLFIKLTMGGPDGEDRPLKPGETPTLK